MALLTKNIDVRSIKPKVRLYVVIECPYLPGNGVVAGVAALMEIAVVRVVLTVAGHTIAVFMAERLRSMAVLASVFLVQAKEGKAGQVVIEKHGILPVNFRVATATPCAQRPFVCTVIQMARVTAREQRLLENGLDVAIDTCDFLVSAQKSVLRVPVMVKEWLVPGRTAVAGITLIAVMPIVPVILEMAR